MGATGGDNVSITGCLDLAYRLPTMCCARRAVINMSGEQFECWWQRCALCLGVDHHSLYTLLTTCIRFTTHAELTANCKSNRLRVIGCGMSFAQHLPIH